MAANGGGAGGPGGGGVVQGHLGGEVGEDGPQAVQAWLMSEPCWRNDLQRYFAGLEYNGCTSFDTLEFTAAELKALQAEDGSVLFKAGHLKKLARGEGGR